MLGLYAAMPIAEAQIELDAVLNTLVDGVIIIDEKGIVQLFNPACEKIFGYTPDEVIGKNVNMLMPDPFHSEHDQYLKNYLTTHERKIIGIGRKVNGISKNGSIVHIDLAVGETKLNSNSIFIGVIRDLTEQDRQQEKYETLQQQHFHLSRVSAMNEMGSTIAHELNQPMTAAINYLEAGKIMLDQAGPVDKEKIINTLNSAIDQTSRASEIISRLRKFIRTGDLEREFVEVKPCLEAAVGLALISFKHLDIEVNYEIEPRLPKVYVNSIQVQQVMVNLIRNACQALENAEHRRLTVSARKTRDRKFVELCVADTGTGINSEIQKLLFTPFSSNKTDGMGVGLSISHSIITNHGGQIWADRNEPEGARFHFTLPTSDPG